MAMKKAKKAVAKKSGRPKPDDVRQAAKADAITGREMGLGYYGNKPKGASSPSASTRRETARKRLGSIEKAAGGPDRFWGSARNLAAVKAGERAAGVYQPRPAQKKKNAR